MISTKDLSNYISLIAQDRGLRFYRGDYDIKIIGARNKAVEIDFLFTDLDLTFNIYYYHNYYDYDISNVESHDLRDPKSIDIIYNWIDKIAS